MPELKRLADSKSAVWQWSLFNRENYYADVGYEKALKKAAI